MGNAPSRSTKTLRGPAPYARSQPAVVDGAPRALRRGTELARVYRDDVCVVTRVGPEDAWGHCKILEYPSIAAAGRAHARAIARLVEQGFVEEAL